MSEISEVDYFIPAKKQKLSHSITDAPKGEGKQSHLRLQCCNGAQENTSNTSKAALDDEIIAMSPPKSPLPPCKYGANCYRKNILHFAQYSHPMKLKESELESVEEGSDMQEDSDADADTDTDVALDDDADGVMQGVEINECMQSKAERMDTVFMRGPSIVRSYSLLTEEQRRDLIKRAFEMKDVLQRELNETQQILLHKNRELEALRTKLERRGLMLPGEEEAKNGSDLVYIPLYPERAYKEGSAAQVHFRLAESQFYRLLDVKSSFRVVKVEYVVCPLLLQRFHKARMKLTRSRGEKYSLPVLGFHGTKENNIHHICEEGFKLPGDPGFEHVTDTGHYGRGVYFSEYPSYSMTYIRGGRKLLLCQVLPGQIYKCDRVIHGEPLRPGFDSHMSPDGKELVIFNSRHILPNYVVHYKEWNGDFSYEFDE